MATIASTLDETFTAVAPARVGAGRFYHPELDILRFFAFFMVFLHHALPHEVPFWTHLGVPLPIARLLAGVGAMGAFGVSVFFLLSAYLITELLLREKARFGRLDVKSFYKRRILRIWPLYFGFLGFAWALQWIIPGQHIGWRAGLSFTLLAGNWWIVFQGFPSSIIFPLWSVSIEEQFYLLWPAVVRRIGERGMIVAAGLLLVVANVARVYLGMHHRWETPIWSNTFVQLDPIALGILTAVLLRGEAPRFSRHLRVLLVITGIASLALAANYFEIKGDPLTTARIMIGYPMVAFGALAILLAVLSREAILGKSFLVYFGRISYGLYVFHVLGLMISDYTVHNQTASLARYALRVGVAFTLTIILASLSFRFLETPFLNIKQRYTHVQSRPGG